MITYRTEKGYDLTHEELDENFRFFDKNTINFQGVASSCPIDDIWITSIEKKTDSEYLILGNGAFDFGVMTSTPIDVSISAIIPYGRKTEFDLQIIPVLFENYSLSEVKEVSFNGANEDTVIVEFASNVELIEISTNVFYSPALASYDGRYENGQVATLNVVLPLENHYKATYGAVSGKEIQFNVTASIPIPSLESVSDVDPFGDSSQVHHFKFENSIIDENGNANIVGNVSYSAISLYGTSSLKMVNENELTLDLENTDFAINEGFSIVYAGRRSEGSTFPSYGDPPNMFKYREMLTIQGGNGTKMLAEELGMHQYFEGWTPEDSLHDRFGGQIVSGWRSAPEGYDDDYEWYTVVENFYVIGSEIRRSSFGWGAYYGSAVWCQNNFADTNYATSNYYPHTLHFNKALGYPTDWVNCEALIDGLRVFNRPLSMSEKVTLTQHINGSAVLAYQTDSNEKGTYRKIYSIDDSAPIPSINIIVNNTDISIGEGILDLDNRVIEYQKRVALYGNRFVFKISPASGGFQGSKMIVKGYIYNG